MMNQWKAAMPSSFRSVAKIGRARLFEAGGSRRYSMPGLNSLDRQMLKYLPDKGFFLEIGANDGYSQSNTYFLERFRGWTGMLIEPLPSLYSICKRARPNSVCLNFACVGPDGPEAIEMVDLDLMSLAIGLQPPQDEMRRLSVGRGKRFTAATRTLSDLITGVGDKTIDFMSIDVEGAELEVLSGLRLNVHTPRYLLVETKNPEQVESTLRDFMVPVSQLSYHDYLYASESLTETRITGG